MCGTYSSNMTTLLFDDTREGRGGASAPGRNERVKQALIGGVGTISLNFRAT